MSWKNTDPKAQGLVWGAKTNSYKKIDAGTPAHLVKKIEPDVNNFRAGVDPYAKEEKEIKPNAKIKNATKSTVDGVKFDSNLEKFMYGLLKGAGIEFEFQVKYVLQDKFRYRGRAVRAITLTIDFFVKGRNMIIDTKGYANDRAAMKYNMLRWFLFKESEITGWESPLIELPSTKADCHLLLNRILFDK